MAENKLWYLISYDVRDDKRLRRVARHLKGYGIRIQYSLFKCRLNERQLERLRWELTTLMTREDDLLVVGLCAACGDRVAKINPDAEWEADPARFMLV